MKPQKNASHLPRKDSLYMNDLCIRCGKETEYCITTPVDKRFCYVPGSGQMCVECYREVYKLRSDEAETQLGCLSEEGDSYQHLL